MERQDWKEVVTEPEERKVFEALANPEWDYRTIGGLASETGLDRSMIEKTLDQWSDLIRQSPVPSKRGSDLYTLHEPSLREALSLARGAISKSSPS